MTPESELARLVHQTREEARALRQSSEKARRTATELIAHARSLCARYGSLEAQPEEAQFQEEPQPRMRRTINALRLEVLEQLKQSLSDLETIRMIPEHDPELRNLKDEIRKTIQSAEEHEIS